MHLHMELIKSEKINKTDVNVELDQTAIIFFLSSRKLHKYALMCYTYNQTHLNRIQDFKSVWLEEYKRYPTIEEIKTLNEFAVKYNDFIELIFPNKKKVRIIKQSCDISCKHNRQNNYSNFRRRKYHKVFS